MTYKVTLHNKWRKPYFLADKLKEHDKPVCRHIMTDTYEVNDKDTCKEVLKDFLDAPVTEMTLEEVKKEFEDPKIGPIDESRLIAIRDYYNGRLELQNNIFKFIDKIESKPGIWRYDIPFRCNYFACYADEDDENLNHQEDAYIEIEVTDNEPVKIV